MELEKNKEYIVDIVDMGINGEGIAKIDNYPIFIKNAIKGEKVKTATFEEGMMSTAIGQAAELSKEEERVVFIDELLNK